MAAILDSGLSSEVVKDIANRTLDYAKSRTPFSESSLSEDYELAVHQDNSRVVILFGKVFEDFLDKLHKSLDSEIPEEKKALAFDIAFDEKTTRMHQKLLRKYLENGESASLSEITDTVYSESKRPQDFHKKRAQVRDRYLSLMEDILLWDVETFEVTTREGKRQISKYEIRPGEALLAFSKYVIAPLRKIMLLELTSRLKDA